MFRPWIHEMYWTTLGRALAPCKIPEICEIQICNDIPVLLNGIWKLVSTSLFEFLIYLASCISSSFFQFFPLPEETGRNTFFPVSSILPERNLFLPEVSEPCLERKYWLYPDQRLITPCSVRSIETKLCTKHTLYKSLLFTNRYTWYSTIIHDFSQEWWRYNKQVALQQASMQCSQWCNHSTVGLWCDSIYEHSWQCLLWHFSHATPVYLHSSPPLAHSPLPLPLPITELYTLTGIDLGLIVQFQQFLSCSTLLKILVAVFKISWGFYYAKYWPTSSFDSSSVVCREECSPMTLSSGLEESHSMTTWLPTSLPTRVAWFTSCHTKQTWHHKETVLAMTPFPVCVNQWSFRVIFHNMDGYVEQIHQVCQFKIEVNFHSNRTRLKLTVLTVSSINGWIHMLKGHRVVGLEGKIDRSA